MTKSIAAVAAIACALVGVAIAAKPTNEISIKGVNLGKHVAGPEVSKKHLQGRVVLFEYWGDRCGPCLASIPHLCKLQKTYPHKDFIIVANQVWTKDKSAAKRAWEAKATNKLVAVFNHGSLAGAKVRGVPHAFLLDHTGKLIWEGHPASRELDEKVKQAVAAKRRG